MAEQRPIAEMRVEYSRGGLRESDLLADPMRQFEAWFDEARAAGLIEPNAMTLCTVDSDGVPHGRVVLLKGIDQGFVFFTNYQSDKARQIAAHPQVALVFYWDRLERSVRISGEAGKTSRQESETYFRSRPRKSQIGAWVSDQSSVVASRDVLEQRFAELAARYPEGTDVPCPPFWGGYRVIPEAIEFWQGQRSRLHDRLRYMRQADGRWRIERLAP